MPPLTAVYVLVPAVAPSRSGAGRELDAAAARAVAAEAAGLLAQALHRQGLTPVHFSAQRECLLWHRKCIEGLFKGCLAGFTGD